MYRPIKPTRLIDNMILNPGETISRDLKSTEIVSLCKGEIRVSVERGCEQVVTGKNMFLLPAGTTVEFSAIEETNIIIFRIEDNVEMISYFDMEALRKSMTENDSKLHTLNHLSAIRWFLDSLIMNVENGLRDEAYLHMKYTELFTLLRFYYDPQQLADFLRPMMGSDIAFRTFVYQNISKVKSVQEFAELYHMSEVGFRKKFRKEMGVSPREIMTIRKKKMIYDELVSGTKSLKEISGLYGFNSVNYLTTYSVKHFGMPPSELRKKAAKELNPAKNIVK